MQVIPLGAGQDVGRSCIIVTINEKTIMLDCGMHMGYHDARRFPDFSFISKTGQFNKIIDCIIISHYHLDHCGALPYFTEVCGFDGPIYMTHPTRAVVPIILEDFRKISAEKFRDNKSFTKLQIESCMKKVITINMNETYEHEPDFIIKPYYAGHVIGAAMFYIKVGNKSFIYTGDFNTTPDRHLGGAWIDKLEPDLLITESTYGSTIRECRKFKEREFLNSVYETVSTGGKVLIPIFALGRSQELSLLLDSYWERMGLKIPIYSSSGISEKTNQIYKLFINYTNESMKKNSSKNPFDFKNITPFNSSVLNSEGPMVLFASPGMLHSGTSLAVFKKWCDDPLNLIIIPGYCVKGTIGEKILNGEKEIEINKVVYHVRMKVKNLGFSAHADSNGILQIIEQCMPKNVLLVHGEFSKMLLLKKKIIKKLNVNVLCPSNGTITDIPVSDTVEIDVAKGIIPRNTKKRFLKIKIQKKENSINFVDCEEMKYD